MAITLLKSLLPNRTPEHCPVGYFSGPMMTWIGYTEIDLGFGIYWLGFAVIGLGKKVQRCFVGGVAVDRMTFGGFVDGVLWSFVS